MSITCCGALARNSMPARLRPQNVQWCFAPHQQPRSVRTVAGISAFGSRVEILLEFRHGRNVEVLQIGGASAEHHLPAVARHQALKAGHRLLLEDRPEDFRQRYLCVAAEDIVDLRTAADHLLGNVILQRGAAEHDRQGGVALLQRARQRDTGEQLLKDQREPDETEPAPVHAVDAEIDEAWSRVIADTAKIRNRTAGELADGAEVALENLEIFRVFLVLAKRSPGPDPLAD